MVHPPIRQGRGMCAALDNAALRPYFQHGVWLIRQGIYPFPSGAGKHCLGSVGRMAGQPSKSILCYERRRLRAGRRHIFVTPRHDYDTPA